MIKTIASFAAILALVALCCSSCAEESFTKGPSNGGSDQDQDKDGYSIESGDCDDQDKEVYPGAPERVNCIDDNCNDKVDEGTDNEDLDGDGYCPSTGDTGECEGDVKRNPGAPEDGGNGSLKPNGVDDNCNGIVDDGLPDSDLDKDGFAIKDGDCNDDDPFINPGAIEVEGMHCKNETDCPLGKCFAGYCRCVESKDCSSGKTCTSDGECTFAGEQCKGGVCTSTYTCLPAQEGLEYDQLKVCRDNTDNNCNQKIDELPVACDDPTKLNQDDPYDHARAMELCDVDRTCGLDAPCPGKLKCVNNRCRRVLSASFSKNSSPKARRIATAFALNGPFKPRMGQSFVVLSTGLAEYDYRTDCPQEGTIFGNTDTDPDPMAILDNVANDYIHLELEILVPTNAQSFDFDFHFFSTEYPEYVGSTYNDTFWVQLSSQKFTGNISFDKNNTPIRINNAFFSICDPYAIKPQTLTMCTVPAINLAGTGYAKECKKGLTGDFNVPNGGSTDWLHTTSPVTPGETIKLTFSIFDKGDFILDSAVLIDNFRWKLAPAQNPTTGPD